MCSANPTLGSDNPRNQIIDIYLATIAESLSNNRPAIKLINFGTGSGKTYQFFQSICTTIQNQLDTQIIGLYVAPLREHLIVPSGIIVQYPDIPLYILYSQEWKTTDDFLDNYRKWLPSLRRNHKLWSSLTKTAGSEKAGEANTSLGNALKAIDDYVLLRRFNAAGNELLSSKLVQAQREITGSIEKFLDIFLRAFPDEAGWPEECLKLTIIYYPLFLLREKSGILLMTYDKFETRIPYFANVSGKWVKREALFDQYVLSQSENKRFIVAFDEQEDGYQAMLERQIDIISPDKLAINNALSSIYREFALLFSSENKKKRDFLKFIKKNQGALRELNEYVEKDKEIDDDLLEMANIFRRLAQDEGNSDNFLLEIAQLSADIDNAFVEIAEAFGRFGETPAVQLDFEKLARILATFENNRGLIIPRKVYAKYAEDLMNIFSYNNLYIYDIELLKNLLICRKDSGHVLIDERKEGEDGAELVSVAELIYVILAMRMQIEAVRKLLKNVLDAEDSQSRSLDVWFRQINRLQKANTDNPVDVTPTIYLDRAYVYKSSKSIINIMEISRYQTPGNNLIRDSLREISIGSTAILTSPEHRILSMLKGTGNVVFLISATGGVYEDLSTSFDMRYLEDEMRDDGGHSTFAPMRENELRLSEQIRDHRRQNRDITVSFFADQIATFPNRQTREAVTRFEQSVLKKFLDARKDETRQMGSYKIQELQNFVRYLFYLFEDESIQEVIAFTQTLSWIKQLLQHAEMVNHTAFQFHVSPEHPNIYTVELKHNSYISPLKVKLILYESRFNSLYQASGGTTTYHDELVERDGQKIFFISAYQSASKGLNPAIRLSPEDVNGKDFDALVLLMDRYFTVMGPGRGKSRDPEKSTTQLHFALMKNLVHRSNSPMEIRSFNHYLNDPEAREFQELQHRILLGKGILQSIGRTERRDFPGQVIKIFINDETRKNLVHYYRHLEQAEPYEIRKLSVNNYEVYQAVQAEERKRVIPDYPGHVFDELEATLVFQSHRMRMLEAIDRLHEDARDLEIVAPWELLRAPLAFSDPAGYLDKLHQAEAFPADFVDSLFYRRRADQPDFVPYVAFEDEDGKKYAIISDSIHGDKPYLYKSRLYPEFLKIGSRSDDSDGEYLSSGYDPMTEKVIKMFRKFIPHPELFDVFIPRPHFFYDVLYPSLAENMVAAWIREVLYDGKTWPAIYSAYGLQPMEDFEPYHKLFERFDLFYTRKNTLYCIDVKAWSEPSGYRLSQKTIAKAQDKLKIIRSNYPEFAHVYGLLLNLHAPLEKSQKLSDSLYSGNLFYLDHNHRPLASSILNDFLFLRGQ